MKIFTLVTNALVILLLLATPSRANLLDKIYEDPTRAVVLETSSGQYNAGLSLLRTVQNYKAAVKWFRQAALQGHATAQTVLGSFYAVGLGVPKDFVIAYAWVSLALPQLDGSMLHRAEALQDELESFMNPTQLKQARALTDSWFTMFPMDR